MWAAVVGNIVSFSFKQNYTYKTYFWLNYNIRIPGTSNYFLLDVRKGINNGQIEIIWLFLNLVYYIDFYKNGQEEKGFMIMTILKFQCSFCLVFEVLK